VKILKVIPQAFYTTRGTPLSAYHRTKELVARGHEVDILTYAVGGDPPDLAVRVYRSRGPHFSHSIEAGPSRLKIWFDLLLFLNLIYRLMVKRYDLIYAHEEGAFLARIAGAIFRVPYVYDMHSSLPLQITDWKFSSNQRVIDFFSWVARVSIRGARAVIAISPAVAQAARDVDPDVPIITIVNHFEIGEAGDPEAASALRAHYGIKADQKVVLYTGSFVALQALDLLVDAVPFVTRAVPQAVFLVVGGQDAEIASLRARAEKLGVAGNVVFERSRPQKEMPTYMAAADVLVSPRVQGINPPGKLLSYLASGRPVVATNTLVHNQLLNDQCAVLTPPNAEGIAQGLIKAITDQVAAANVVREAALFLERYGSKAARDIAYETLFAAAGFARKPRRMKLLVVAPQPFYTPRGTPLSVYYRTLLLAEQGAEVDLLTYGQGSDVDLPSTRIIRIPGMHWIGQIPAGPSWKKMFLDFFMIIWTIGLLIQHRYRVVHAHEEAVFWCRYLKPVFRFKLVYDMHSSLPQQLTNFAFTESRTMIALFRYLEESCLLKAEAVITICPDLRDYALACGVDPARHLLIENSLFDDVRMRRVTGSSVARKGQGPDPESVIQSLQHPLIVYAGTFESYQGIDILIRSFSMVLQSMPQAMLLLAGGTSAQVADMRKLANASGAERAIVFTGTVDKKTAMRFTALADALVSPRKHGTNTPLKIYEQLASGKPLVATRIWSHTQVLNDDVCILVEPNPESMAAGLVQALSNGGLAARLSANARRLYDDHYSRPIYEGKIQQLLKLVF
jgi:glycosyltransferase involved in cell wall biosynthesis